MLHTAETSSDLGRATLPYPAIERHGVIGDRRTAALVAADGTVDWLCLPDYDGQITFGSILDHDRGGHWRLGPHLLSQGTQRYEDGGASLITDWTVGGGRLELTDALAWPEDDRPADRANRRVLLRRLRCLGGTVACAMEFAPARDFAAVQLEHCSQHEGQIAFDVGSGAARLWAGHDGQLLRNEGSKVRSRFELRAGQVLWCVLEWSDRPTEWSAERAAAALAETERYWQRWSARLPRWRPRARAVRRSALAVHLLSYAPAGSLVAAPTTSLPERIGGDWNADYRYAWIRDASLSLAIMAMLGNTDSAERYMQWLTGLGSSTDSPLQIMYGIRGETELAQCERNDVPGYRGSRPVRFGNHAYSQRQNDALGYLNDCVHVYLQHGGRWRGAFWELVERVADHTADHWRLPDNGIWELSVQQHWVSSKVMSWVALERAVKIAERLGHQEPVGRWRSAMDAIHADVMQHGWSERLGAFKQRYEGENLDASVLLIPVMGFLPQEHPRVKSTVDQIAERLAIDGFVYRFDPPLTPGADSDLPLGEHEGTFLPCTFWLATAYAKMGKKREAQSILARAEAIAGPLGLFAEAVDVRSGTFLGNTPLMFSQIEYARAVTELAKAQPFGSALLAASKVATWVRNAAAGWLAPGRFSKEPKR